MFWCNFVLILYSQSAFFQSCWDWFSWVEPVLSRGLSVCNPMAVLLDRLDNQTKYCPNFIHSKTILYVKVLQQYSCNLLF